MAAGVALMAAPRTLGYPESGAADLHWIAGPLVTAVAAVAMWDVTLALRWANLVPALALAAGPLLLPHPAEAVAVGEAAAVVVAATLPWGGRRRHSFGGGWSELWGGEKG
jgi:hypothetical protein